MNAAFLMMLGMIVYIFAVMIIYRVIFNRIKVGDLLYVYEDEDYCNLDVVIMVDEENDVIRTKDHGDFSAMDLFRGNISIPNRNQF